MRVIGLAVVTIRDFFFGPVVPGALQPLAVTVAGLWPSFLAHCSPSLGRLDQMQIQAPSAFSCSRWLLRCDGASGQQLGF